MDDFAFYYAIGKLTVICLMWSAVAIVSYFAYQSLVKFLQSRRRFGNRFANLGTKQFLENALEFAKRRFGYLAAMPATFFTPLITIIGFGEIAYRAWATRKQRHPLRFIRGDKSSAQRQSL